MVWSLVYEPMTILDFSRVINKLDLAPPPGELRYTHADTQQLTERLAAKNLVLPAEKQGWIVNPRFSEALMRYASIRPDFNFLLNEIRRELPYKTFYKHRSAAAMMREIRSYFYQQNEAVFQRLQSEALNFFPSQSAEGYFEEPLFREFDPRWIETLLPEWQLKTVRTAFARAIEQWEPLDELVGFLESHSQIRDKNAGSLREILLETYVLRGDWARLLLWADLEPIEWRAAAGKLIYRVLNDQDQQAHPLVDTIRKGYRQEFNGRYPANLAGYLYLLSLLRSGGMKNAELISHYLGQTDPAERLHLTSLYFVMQALQAYLRNDRELRELAETGILGTNQNAITVVFEALYRFGWATSVIRTAI
ncbi:MAG: hypothetical protein HC821_04110 [Lewinella sp.]|nr:hypothetical protein [Lewinella sp.]